VPSLLRAETLEMPLTVDMHLLRSLLITQAYPMTGDRALVFQEGQGCRQIILSSPQVGEDQGYVRFQTGVHLRWGAAVLGSCLAPLQWEGSVVLWQQPRVDSQWRLSFETINSTVLDKNGQPVQIAILLWNLIKDHIHSYLDSFFIDLAPPVNDMKQSLLPMFASDQRERAERFLASMRPTPPLLSPEGIRVNIQAEIDLVQEKEPLAPVPVLDQEHLARVLELWQAWDAFLILQLKQFTDAPLAPLDRYTLLDTMLTVRHDFSEAIEQESLSNAFIREQFVWGWKQLYPVFRRHLHHRSSTNLLGYLAFFTAGDALLILDELGPAVGIEISEDGFRRLAALITTEPLDRTPSSHADPQLRKIFNLPPLPETPLPDETPLSLPETQPEAPTSSYRAFPWHDFLDLFRLATAHATSTKISRKEIESWTAELTPATDLLPKVSDLLYHKAAAQRKELSIPFNRQGWFETMTIATAWQESCFRQFQIKNKKITYLLSYNNTSVGLMQINERVWRGIYNLEQLRWNTEYNSQAGCEILSLYLRDYVLREKTSVDFNTPDGQRYFAGWLYALYNGGPSQRRLFPDRYTTGKLFRSERLFLEKFDAATDSGWMEQVRCLP
jgi:hypothetical protein